MNRDEAKRILKLLKFGWPTQAMSDAECLSWMDTLQDEDLDLKFLDVQRQVNIAARMHPERRPRPTMFGGTSSVVLREPWSSTPANPCPTCSGSKWAPSSQIFDGEERSACVRCEACNGTGEAPEGSIVNEPSTDHRKWIERLRASINGSVEYFEEVAF